MSELGCNTDFREMTALGVRRAKAALSSGCKPHPAIAPAGSNRSRSAQKAVSPPLIGLARIARVDRSLWIQGRIPSRNANSRPREIDILCDRSRCDAADQRSLRSEE